MVSRLVTHEEVEKVRNKIQSVLVEAKAYKLAALVQRMRIDWRLTCWSNGKHHADVVMLVSFDDLKTHYPNGTVWDLECDLSPAAKELVAPTYVVRSFFVMCIPLDLWHREDIAGPNKSKQAPYVNNVLAVRLCQLPCCSGYCGDCARNSPYHFHYPLPKSGEHHNTS